MSSYPTTVLADSPLRYYRMSDKTYQAADASGNNRHGGYNSAGVTYGTAGLLTSDPDTAVTLASASKGMVFLPTHGLPTGNNPFTLECVMKAPGSTGAAQTLMLFGADNSMNSAFMDLDSTGKLSCSFWGHAITAHALTTGTIYHIALTWDGTTLTQWANGSSAGTLTPGAATLGNVYAMIGAYIDGTQAFNGIIEKCAIYASCLSSTRIAAHSSAVTGGGYSAAVLADSPLGYWKLGESTPSATITDSSGNAQNGTSGGAACGAPGLLIGDNTGGNDFFNFKGSTFPTSGLPTGAAAWTIEAWVNIPRITGSFQNIANFGSTAALAAAFLYIDSTGHLSGAIGTTGFSDTAVLSTNTTYYCVATYDGTTLKVYKNASLVASGTVTGAISLVAGVIGADVGNTTNHFNGVMDEVAIYNVALSSSRITAHYNAGLDASVDISVTVSESETVSVTLEDVLAISVVVSESEIVDVIISGSSVAAPIPIYTLFVRDNGTGLVVDVIDDAVRVQAALNFNGISQVLLNMDPTSIHLPSVSQDSDGNYLHGLILTRDNQDGVGPIELFSGPISHYAADLDTSQAPATWTVLITADSDDECLLAGLALPDTDESFTTNAYDTRTGVVSTSMLGYIGDNIGSTAHTERVIANLVLDSDPTLGGSITEAVRFNTLIETFVNMSLRASSELGFQVRQPLTDTNLHFTVYAPRNQTSQALFSLELGNISKLHYQVDAPIANVAYVGGAGSGTSRNIRIRSNSASITRWGRRIEKFYNHTNLSSNGDLDNQGDADLAADADVFALGIEIIESDGCVFLRDWRLGDLVTAVVNIPGLSAPIVVQDIVRQVLIDLQQGKRDIVQPVIGQPGATFPLQPNRAIHKMIYRTQKQVTTLTVNQ